MNHGNFRAGIPLPLQAITLTHLSSRVVAMRFAGVPSIASRFVALNLLIRLNISCQILIFD